LITGLRAIWKGVANKFCIVLFTFLAAISLFLLIPLGREYILLISYLLLGGLLLFMLLAILALTRPLSKRLESVPRITIVQLTLFGFCTLVAILVLQAFAVLGFILIYSGFTAWLVLQGIVSCALAYSVSTRISVRSPRVLGFVFLSLAVLVEVFLYSEVPRKPIISTPFAFYTIAWFSPCVVIALLKYRSPQSFSAYSLVALFYTVFPIGYRLFSIISSPPIPSDRLPAILLLFEEILTMILFIWTLNAIGNFFGKRYSKIREGRQQLVSRLRRSSRDASMQASTEGNRTVEGSHPEETSRGKEFVLEPFLVFGLLFSALAYYAFQHARGPLGIPEFLDPLVGFYASIIVAVPFLLYMVLRKK
jgi:hypothetical protein